MPLSLRFEAMRNRMIVKLRIALSLHLTRAVVHDFCLVRTMVQLLVITIVAAKIVFSSYINLGLGAPKQNLA